MMVFFVILLSACQEQYREVVVSAYEDGHPKVVEFYETNADTASPVKIVEYYPNHHKRKEGSLKNGQKHGKWTFWYDTGVMWSEGFFKNGVEEGYRKAYFENGKLRYEGLFKNGVRVGIWKFYDETGALTKEIDFDKTKK